MSGRFCFVALIVPFLFACTSSKEESQLSSYFVSDGEAKLDRVAAAFEIHHRLKGGFEVIVPKDRALELVALAPSSIVLEMDLDSEVRNLPDSWNKAYHDFDQVQAHLKRVAATHPRLAKLEKYGESKEGRPLFALKISDHVETDEAEPEVMLTAATHGNEIITVEVLLSLLDEMIAGYGTSERFTRMIDGREIYFIPVVNPDGFVIRSRYSNGVDPNREYPGPSHQSTPNPCIAAVMKFFDDHDIERSIDFHSHGGLVMYPWAYTEASVPEGHAKRFEEIARKMTESNGYTPGQIPKILYPALGSSVDYYFWKNATLAFGVEIGDRHAPAPEHIADYVTENRESTWRFLEF